MKMLSKLAFLPFLLLGFTAKAQTETVGSSPKKLRQLYFSMGLGGSFTNARHMETSGANSTLSLTAALPKNYLIRAGILVAGFMDNQPASQKWKADNHRINMVPMHRANTYFLAVGKSYVIEKMLQFQVMAGPGYTTYEEPINITQRTAELGFLGSYAVLDSDLKIHQKPGLLLQAEAMFLPARFAGITVGGYYHFVPKISEGGITLSLNLGRIRTKEIENALSQ
jgi:hypothetical protein